MGKALRELEREAEATAWFEESAAEAGDFQAMAVTEHSELSYFRGLSLVELGRSDDAKALFQSLHAFAEKQMESEAKIDYFATSLPLLAVFEDDLDEVKNRRAAHLLKLAKEGLSRQEAMQ